MTDHPLKAVIAAADRAITAEAFDEVMAFYAEEASLVIRPGLVVTGKAAIRRAFVAIAEHFKHRLVVKQGDMTVLEGADTALVIMDSILEVPDNDGNMETVTRRATYVFRKTDEGDWLCVIDNSYGVALLDRA
jgi:uncharacterized protein (TIGR02246 family)